MPSTISSNRQLQIMWKTLLTTLFALTSPRMTPRRRRIRRHTPEALEARVLLTVRIWNGGAALNDKWSDKDNWVGDVAPVSNDDLIFPQNIGVLDRSTNNDIFNATFNSIRFQAGDFKLTGNAIKLSGFLQSLASPDANTIEFGITFTAAAHTIQVVNTLNLNGRLTNVVGSGSITKIGAGILTFGGGVANALTQPLRVFEGELRFQKSGGVGAFAGPLTIGEGPNGANVAKVLINQDNALVNSPAVTINLAGISIGILSINPSDRVLRIGALTLKGGRTEGAGTLQLNGDVIVENSSAIQNGKLNLGAQERKFTVGAGAILEINADIIESTSFGPSGQGFRLLGGGTMQLFPGNNNTYKARTIVSDGVLEINAAVAGRTVIPGDLLVGSGLVNQARVTSIGENIIADTSNIRLNGLGKFEQFFGSETIGSLFMIESTRFLAFAPSPKLFRVLGTTNVDEQALFEARNTTAVLFEGDVRILGASIVAAGANLTFRQNLVLRGGKVESKGFANNIFGRLFFEGSIATEASPNPSTIAGLVNFKSGGISATLAHRLDVVDGAALNDLVIDAAIEQGSSTKKLFKAALGKLVINGNNTATNEIELAAGTLLMNGEQSNAASKVTVTQGVLGGIGSLRNVVLSGGTLAPGLSPGLFTSSKITLVGPAKLQVELNGIAPITQHDQVSAGDFNLGEADANLPTLEVLVGFTTALDQTFEIADVRNDSGTIGRFKDAAGNILNQGSTFIAGGVAFQISYSGGDGNDVTIKRVSTPPAFEHRSITPVITEGGFVTLSGLITEPDVEDTFFLDVNWGDGTTETFTFAPGSPRQVSVAHRYLDDAPSGTARDAYSVHLEWRDAHGGSTSADLRTLVRNAAPQVTDLAFDAPPVRGQDAILRGRIFDPSPLDPIRLRINWGDGSAIEVIDLPAGTSQFQLTHRFAKAGLHLVRIQAFDDDGGRSRVARLRFRVGRG